MLFRSVELAFLGAYAFLLHCPNGCALVDGGKKLQPSLIIPKSSGEKKIMWDNPINSLLLPIGSPSIAIPCLFLAVLASLVCYVLWNVVLKQLGTVRASNYIYLNPLVTMVASVIILHEKITWITLLGAGCIIFGVYQAEKK